MKIESLQIQHFRDLPSTTSLRFSHLTNVLLGENATGKSTLLDLLVSISRGDFRKYARERIRLSYTLSGAFGAATISYANEPQGRTVSRRVDIPQIPSPETFTTSVEISIQPPSGEPPFSLSASPTETVFRRATQVIPERGIGDSHDHSIYVRAGAALFEKMPREATQYVAMLANAGSAPARYDEALDFFSFIQRDWYVFMFQPDKEKGDNTAAVFSPQTFPMDVYPLFRDFLKHTKETDVLRISSAQDKTGQTFLSTVANHFGMREVVMRLERVEKTDEATIYSNCRFDFVRPDGRIFNQDQLSFGQKRLLSFLFYLSCCSDIVVADELVNGLHHRWIADCLSQISGRQRFLTSQNPLLLDHLSFANANEVQATFIRCTSEAFHRHRRFRWTNMTRIESDTFFNAYSAGIQYVGEILRTQGLW